MAATAVLGLWLPWTIISHAFAALWVLKTLFISRATHSSKQKDTSSNLDLVPPTADTSDSERSSDYDTCITIADLDAAGQRAADQCCSKDADNASKGLTAALQQHHMQQHSCMEWQQIGCKYKVPGGQKTVLQDIWGKAFPGEMQVRCCTLQWRLTHCIGTAVN